MIDAAATEGATERYMELARFLTQPKWRGGVFQRLRDGGWVYKNRHAEESGRVTGALIARDIDIPTLRRFMKELT